MIKLPKLPAMLQDKLYKTGTTRAASKSQIYQNRVKRNDTVLIPFNDMIKYPRIRKDINKNIFENGYIVLISPKDFFNNKILKQNNVNNVNLTLGKNLLIFFRNRQDWNNYKSILINNHWVAAYKKRGTFGGQYVARIPNTTSINSSKIYKGFMKTQKGAGIRLYEYSSYKNIKTCELQLEAIFWMCRDACKIMHIAGMSKHNIIKRRTIQMSRAKAQGLLNKKKLVNARIINNDNKTICPLCLKEISAKGFITRKSIPKGRHVPDLTITTNNLFHIHGLEYGKFCHKPYNLGWGHHYCNLVQADHSIKQTLHWMRCVVKNNNYFKLKLHN